MLSLSSLAVACSTFNLIANVAGAAIPSSYGPRKFDLTVTRDQRAPNGVSRQVILINGQYPGPTLEMNQGEEVWVTIHNSMSTNTTMHYHGIEMEGTPWSDGVPGITQREILPGGSFVSKFNATQYGEYWYHAHSRGQIDDGQYGALVIHPQASTPTPFSLITTDQASLRAISSAVANIQPLILSDWRNQPADEIWDIQTKANMEIPCYDSLLINGQGRVDCWSQEKLANLTTPQQQALLKASNATGLTVKGCLPKGTDAKIIAAPFPTNTSAIPPEIFDQCTSTEGSEAVFKIPQASQSGPTWAAFDVIGAYSLATTNFSIDDQSMWVYAVDGEYIKPQQVDSISVANGARYSFLLKLTKPGNYTIRQAGILPVQLLSGQGTLSYGSTSGSSPSTPWLTDAGSPAKPNVIFFDAAHMKPFNAPTVAQKADKTFILTLSNTQNASYIWAMNGTAQLTPAEDDTPVLFHPQPNLVNNLTISTLNNTWVDLIFGIHQFPQPSHPIHKHGNKMWLIGSGNGLFNWTSVDAAMKDIPQNFNLVDPPRRDTFGTVDAPRGPTWTAVRYHVTNPGPWFLHCHIQTHLRGGMNMVIQDGVDHWPKVPKEYQDHS